MAAGERPDPEDYILFDANDGRFLYDANDEYFIRDGDDEIILPPVPGSLDPVGGPIGGPVGERVILIDTPDSSAGTVAAEWLAIANHPISGRMLGALPAAAAALILRVADRDFVTLYNDTVAASQYWDGRVIDP